MSTVGTPPVTVVGNQRAAAPAGARGLPARAGRLVGRARRRAGTSPGQLRVLSVLLVLGLVALWVTAFTTLRIRHGAVDELRTDSGASFIAAQSLHANLSAADATVARAFLAGGVEPPDQRAAYSRSIAAASDGIVDLAQATGQRKQLSVVSAELPVYTGLVERARANNRLGLVVGGAYLRQASELMQGTILPAVDAVAAADAVRIDDGFTRASSWYHPVLVAGLGLVAVAGLLAVQVRLSRRTHRILNLPLVAATVLTLVALGLTLGAFGTERARLLDSRDGGFAPMTIDAQARVLGLRAWGDESLSLIARGNGTDADTDAGAAIHRLGYGTDGKPIGGGVLAAASALDRGHPLAGQADGRDTLESRWRAYQQTNIRVRQLVTGAGGFQDAVALALGDGTTSFARFNGAADAAFAAREREFETRLAAAGDVFGGLAGGVSAALVLAAALTLAGLQTRINDYR